MPLSAVLWLVPVLRLALAALLLFSGIMKLFDLKGFYVTVVKFGILPRKLAKPFAYSLPFFEIIVGAMLLLAILLPFAALAAALLMVVSEIGIAGALLKQKKIDNCGCFGAAFKVPVTWRKFAENIGWLVAAVAVFWATLA
jgi:hypothetical protein